VGTSGSVINVGRRWSHLPGGFGWALVRAAGLVVATLLAQSFFWSPSTPVALKTMVAAVALVAAARPDVALLVLAVVVPFGRIVSAAMSPSAPVGITEALVLAFLAGWFWSCLGRDAQRGPSPAGLWPGYLFASVVVASVLVEIGVYRYWRDYWQPFLGQLIAYLARDFLNAELETRPWATAFGLPATRAAAVLLEGIGLTWAVQAVGAGSRTFGRRLLWALAVAAVGTAIASMGMALHLASVEGRSLLSVLQADRFSVHTSKVNTAASSFVLFIPVLIGLERWYRRSDRHRSSNWVAHSVAMAAGTGLLLTALWMTGTRAAMAAATAVAVGAFALAVMRRRVRWRNWRSSVAILVTVTFVLVLFGLRYYARTTAIEAGTGVDESFHLRILMWRTALSMCAEFPIFGAGIGQFPFQASAFNQNEILGRIPRFNAHNQFLEVAAELGMIGGSLFIGMFAAILWRAWKAFRTSRDAALGGAIAGVVAFLITCLGGQPLLYDIVAFPFWMVLGVLTAGGDMSPEAAHAQPTPASRRLWSRVIAGFLVFLALSIPVRVWQGKERVNFALARYGFSGLLEASDGTTYRLVRDDGTFFTYPHARWLKLPIQRAVEAGRNRLDVDVSLDGRLARTLTLADDEWHTVEFMIPADASRRFRRVDLSVRAPAGVSAQVRVGAAEIREDETLEKGRAR
jgi:O-antigen ligase